jgi:DNA polymerase III delta prime subunit
MNLTFCEKKPTLHDLDFKNENLLKLSKIDIDSIPNLLIYGSKCCGKTTIINAFFATLFDTKFYDMKNMSIEIDRKIFNYKMSGFHLEFCAKELGTNDKIFIHDFIKSFIETRNIGLDIPKIVIIRNASFLTSIAQMSLRRIIEKNYFTSRFIFEIEQLSSFQEPLQSRCLKINVKLPSHQEIKKSILKMSIDDNIILDDDFIDKIINESVEYKNTKLYNLKKIYGKYYHYKYTGKEFVYFYDNIVEELIKTIETKKIVMSNLEKIRDIINELYINLYPMKKLIFYTFYHFINKYKNNQDFIKDILELTVKTDINMCNGNKECIHTEFYFIALFELLLNHKCSF